MTRADIVKEWEDNGASTEEAIVIIKAFDGTLYDVNKLNDFSYAQAITKHIRKYEDDDTEIVSKTTESHHPPIQTPTLSTPSSKNAERKRNISLPDEIIYIELRIKELLKKRSQLHTLLISSNTQQKRYELAHELVCVIRPQLDRLYFQKRQWKNEGIVPPIIHSNIIKWVNAKHAEKKSITEKLSRLNRSLKNASGEEAIKIQDQIEMLQLQRSSINQDLQLA